MKLGVCCAKVGDINPPPWGGVGNSLAVVGLKSKVKRPSLAMRFSYVQLNLLIRSVGINHFCSFSILFISSLVSVGNATKCIGLYVMSCWWQLESFVAIGPIYWRYVGFRIIGPTHLSCCDSMVATPVKLSS